MSYFRNVFVAKEEGDDRATADRQKAMTSPQRQQRYRDRYNPKSKLNRLLAKQGRRAERERVLGAQLVALPDLRFGVILEDLVRSPVTGMDWHAANHYPVSADAHTAEEIVARTAERFTIAAENCALFMCATAPYLAVAMDVLRLRVVGPAPARGWAFGAWGP